MFKNGVVGRLFLERQRREDMLALALAMKIRPEEYDSRSLAIGDNDKVRKFLRLAAISGEIC